MTSSDSEWTQVRKSRRSRPSHPKNLPRRPSRTDPLRSPEDLVSDYHRIRTRWESEQPCIRLRQLVASSKAVSVTRAVNLGVGTFDPVDGAWEAKRSAFVQLSAFFVMVEELGEFFRTVTYLVYKLTTAIEKLTGEKIECIFQDPVFTESDKQFLTNLGHTVVETPTGCEMITSETLFFAIHLYRPIYAMALENHLPAIFVGTGWDTWDECVSRAYQSCYSRANFLGDRLSKTDGLENMEKMSKSYTVSPFPRESFDSAFSSTSIYWKFSLDESKEEVVEKEKTVKGEETEEKTVEVKPPKEEAEDINHPNSTV